MGTIALEEYELMKDSKYRVYVSAVDKALKSFEYTSEWADLISALGKLNKVLISHTKFPVIPRRIKISKRLAQCMHPALPSGVHLKALETYDIIFKCMGTNRLSHELFIYSAGLFPLLGHAAMNVRPSLLTVYETHFVPLGERLGPGLSGFLSGVLPGLEEGSDHFDRTNSLLEKVCEGVGTSLFYGCLWDCLASNAAVRLPAISFVLSHYDRRLSTEDQLHIMGTNIDIMIEGLCACVHDSSVLVQRSALDLLLIGFPMHNSQLVKSDMTRLVTASLATILRRDMSLNRRLYAWLLGSEVNISLLSSEHPLVKRSKSLESLTGNNLTNLYFEMYSREMLVQAIKNILSEATGQSPHDLRPYRLLVSLLDKVDIGPVILDDILFEVFRLLYLCCSGSTKSNSVELFKSANLLFSSLEPRYMWHYTGQLVASACARAHLISSQEPDALLVNPVGSGDPGLVEVCALTEFLLDTVSVETYSDTPSEHLPALFLQIVTLLTDHCDMLSPDQTAHALQLCAKILTRVQPTILAHRDSNAMDTGIDVVKEHHQKEGTGSEGALGTDTTSVSDSASQSSQMSAPTPASSVIQPTTRSKENHSVLEQCLRQYEKFYVTFVYGTRLKVGETKSISVLLETLKIKSNQTSYEERARQLETLLRAVLDDKGGGRQDSGDPGDIDITPIFMSGRRVGGMAGLEWAPAMTVASRLLVDLSTLQTFFQVPSTNNILDQNDAEVESSIDILPEWLRVLIVCACWLHSSTSLQMIAISTLLDLVTLCRTAQSLVASSNTDHQSVTTVLILPLLTPAHLRYMENHTNIFQVIAHWLWGQLRSPSASERVRSVELLHQLQSALATSYVVEDCIGEAFSARSSGAKLEAFRTFATLWHIGREVNARLGNSLRISDIFYKSMLKMLDNLQLPESSALKVEAQNWLLHSLLRGDIHRLLDPLLMILLDPATARVSVLHVRIQQHDETNRVDSSNSDDKTPRIYAISSVDGNVIYHVSEKCQKNDTKPGKAKRVFAVQTTLAGQDPSKLNTKYVTEKKATIITDDANDPYQAHSKNLNLLQNISVFVNPFSRDSLHKMETINTDFDDYYEDQMIEQNGDLIGKAVRISGSDLDKNKSKSIEGSNRLGPNDEKPKSKNFKVQRNNSFTSLDHDFARSDSNQTTKSSIDILQLSTISDTIFTKVSDGESLIEKSRNGRGSISSEGLATAASTNGNGELVRSWSFPGKDSESCDPDESASAEEYFKSPNVSEAWTQLKDSDGWTVVEEVMNDLLDRVAALSGEVEVVKESSSSEPSLRSNSMSTPQLPRRHLQYRASLTSGNVDHLHSHLLLYCGVYDSQRALYALQTMRNMLATNARAFLCSSSTTGLVSRSPLLKLVSRHRKSIFGRGFLGELDSSSTRSCMYLEVIISTCLYYMRSYYPNLGQNKLTAEEIHVNRQVQISSVEMLSLVCYELTAIVRDSGRGLACYLADLLSRIKLQKITLHCVLTSIPSVSTKHQVRSFTHEILMFNENTDDSLANQNEAFQVQILRFLLSLIMLEHEVNQRKGEVEEPKSSSHESTQTNGELRYVSGRALPQQPMLLTAILRALEAPGRASYAHTHWTALVTCALPYLGSALTKMVTAVVKQLCANVEQLSRAYDPKEADYVSMPADYAITQVEALTVLCHYCLLDTATPFNSPMGGSSTPSQIFNNLIHVFMPSPLLMNKEKLEPQVTARKAVLGNLPRVIASVAVLWHALTQRKERESENCEAGSARVVRQQLLEFLSPIALHHGTSFLAAMAVVWRERRPANLQANYGVLAQASEGQQVLVQLLSAIKAMPIDTLVQTLHQVVKQPAMNQQTAMSVEVSALELFLHYLQLIPGVSLGESWGSLLSLLREGPLLSAPAQFLLVGVLSQFVHRCPALQDKKDVRDLQDITAKLVESCSQIAGANLEQTTWLRRNLAVKEEEIPQPPSPDCADRYEELETEPVINGNDNLTSYDVSPQKKIKSKSKLKRVTKKIRQDAEKLQIRALHQWFSRSFVHEGNFPVDQESLRNSGGPTSVAQYSVAALTVLAQLLAPLLDITYGSQEKERVVAILTTLMYNVTPYLKNHTQRNVASFYASSQLVASLSGFQYTRKAWRKDVMDLLLDPALFQMEGRTLTFWRTIVDNLMSQDTATFRDLMSRVSMSQGNSLSLFSSREQEYEQRAQLLKRLAFVILCSEKDQFHKHTPDIQERLAESLRLPQVVPGVQSQVFLCFRVLLLRMSPHHVTSLWPIIVSEMVQVMLHMEHDLSTDTEEFRRNNSSHLRLLSSLDWSWVVNSNNGLHANGHPHWLQLQLAAAKLLHLAVQLPADTLPQFQMYRWAFVSPKCSPSSSQVNADFIPHVTRIARLMDSKFGGPPEQIPSPLLPPGSSIRALRDLHPFFTVMSSGNFTPMSMSELETNIELDFLEPMPAR